jgi:hypothetical protein
LCAAFSAKETTMLDQDATRPGNPSPLRRSLAGAAEAAHHVGLLQRSMAALLADIPDWDGEMYFSSGKPLDRARVEVQHASLDRLLITPAHPPQVMNYALWPGWQTLTPQYDRSWGVGTGWPLAEIDGGMLVVGSDGFSASGFGLMLESDEAGLVSIYPSGTSNSSWVSLKDLPMLRSRAGAGTVIFDGDDLVGEASDILVVTVPE